MSMNPRFFVLSILTSSFLFAISVYLFQNPASFPYISENFTSSQYRTEITELLEFNFTALLGLNHTVVPPRSLTAILPILSGSLHHTPDLLAPFLVPQKHVREVVILCPDAIVSSVRRILQQTFASLGSADHPDISLRPLHDFQDSTSATLRAAADVNTDWVLIMDDRGLTNVHKPMQFSLLHPPTTTVPLGPEGESLSAYQSTRFPLLGPVRPAKYLLPPFIMPISLALSIRKELQVPGSRSWIDFGRHIAKHRFDAIGGMVLEPRFSASFAPSLIESNDAFSLIERRIRGWEKSVNNDPDSTAFAIASTSFKTCATRFLFFLPTREDLRRAIPLICAMQSTEDRQIRILIYDDEYIQPTQVECETEFIETHQCVIKYDILTGRAPLSFTSNGSIVLSDWFGDPTAPVDMIISLREMDPLVGFLISERKESLFQSTTVIRIPRLDLDHTEWMSSLSPEEWKSWHIPRIDISVITKDRPQSLMRLLESLSNARYFGDPLDLRINVEQDCDAESLKITENIIWPFGRVFVHHRIIHGGLLPAVVESWYPKDNDSYGLLLEDDVELSPLFYAWIKMTVLRYRYGDAVNRVPNVYGISLYQQKHLELLPEGRQPFNPRSLFSKAGLPHPTTPYLSQVPCSWGAVYFPDHWREFHDYLSVRLAETFMMIEDHVVPHVRSNHWSKSWKRFFIELVYLRGYVMLYPNYENFLSFSTNHLEVGSHVKVRSLERQDLFLLPLMQLQEPQERCTLLDLPGHTLPRVDMLPVLNLTGFLTSLEEIVQRGNSRRFNLTDCETILLNCMTFDPLCALAGCK